MLIGVLSDLLCPNWGYRPAATADRLACGASHGGAGSSVHAPPGAGGRKFSITSGESMYGNFDMTLDHCISCEFLSAMPCYTRRACMHG